MPPIVITPIVQFTTPVPMKTDPVNFASRADTMVSEFVTVIDSQNDAITEMNKITSGLDSTTPTAAYAGATTYNFPDVVAGSDGDNYRCMSTGIVGEDPVGSVTGNWAKITALGIDSLKAHGNAGTALTIDCRAYDCHTFTCDQATLTITATNFRIGRNVTLVIINGGNCVITWPTGTKWPYGNEPGRSTSGLEDRIQLHKVGSASIHASLAGGEYA